MREHEEQNSNTVYHNSVLNKLKDKTTKNKQLHYIMDEYSVQKYIICKMKH